MAALQAVRVTPSGRGALHVIRIDGPAAHDVVHTFLRRRDGRSAPQPPIDCPVVRRWVDAEQVVDEVVVVFGRRGERASVTVSTHGSGYVAHRVLQCLGAVGAEVRAALSPEQHWSISGLTRDAMAALPRARTPAVARWLTDQITAVPHYLQSVFAGAAQDAQAVPDRLLELAATWPSSQRLLNGVGVVLMGLPNVGKSTLANHLFERPWSSTSEDPGTTRDWVQGRLAIAGVPIELIDTAGLHATPDLLEQQAIRGGLAMAERSDVQVAVIDGTPGARLPGAALARMAAQSASLVLAVNKADLTSEEAATRLARRLCRRWGTPGTPIVVLSALRELGLDALRTAMLRAAFPGGPWPTPAVWESTQRDALQHAAALFPTDPGAAQALIGRTFLPDTGMHI